MKASELASFTSGLTFMLSGYMLSVHNLIPHLFSVSWFPLVLLNFLKYMDERRLPYIVLTSFCLTMQFLAGAAEILLMTLLVLLVLLILLSKKRILSEAKPFLFLLFLFLLLSSIQLFPFLELHLCSIRRGGLSYFEATTWSFAYKDFLLFFMPDAFGYGLSDTKYWQNQSWLKTIYLGFAPFFLSILYLLSKDRKKWLFLLLMSLSFLFALGKHTPLYRLIYHIPPFGSVRYPVKFLFLFFFSISITTGLGLDVLKEGVLKKDKRIEKAVKIVFYLGFLFFLSFAYVLLFKDELSRTFELLGFCPPEFNTVQFNIHNLRRFLIFSAILSMLPLFLLNLRFKKFLLLLIVSVMGADLFLANYGYWIKADWKAYIAKGKIVERLEKSPGRYFVTPRTSEEFKFFPRNKIALGPYYASLFGLSSIDGSEVMRIKWHERFLNLIKASPSFEAARKWLEIGGVRYLISSKKIEGLKEIERVELSKEIVYLYEIEGAKRTAFFGKVRWARNEEEAQSILLDPKFNHRSELVIEGRGEGVPLSGELIKGDLKILKDEPGRVLIDVDTPQDGFLYLSDTFFPGWKAYVDGKKAEIRKANIAFRAVFVEKGHHTVELIYSPASFWLGLVISVFGILTSIYVLRSKRRLLF